MKGSTATWALMASAPVLFLGILAIVGRTQVEPWVFEEYGKDKSAALLAYARPVSSALQATFEDRSPEALDSSVALWISGFDRGDLTDVLPATLNDQGDRGVKREIFQARDQLVSRIMRRAVAYRRSGDNLAAAKASVSALRIADVAKYSGVYTVHFSALDQISALRMLSSTVAELSAQERGEVLSDLKKVRSPHRPFESLGSQINRLKIEKDSRYEQTMATLRPFRAVSSLAVTTAAEIEVQAVSKAEREFLQLDPELARNMMLAMRTEAKFQRDLASIKAALGGGVLADNQEGASPSEYRMEQHKNEWKERRGRADQPQRQAALVP